MGGSTVEAGQFGWGGCAKCCDGCELQHKGAQANGLTACWETERRQAEPKREIKAVKSLPLMEAGVLAVVEQKYQQTFSPQNKFKLKKLA